MFCFELWHHTGQQKISPFSLPFRLARGTRQHDYRGKTGADGCFPFPLGLLALGSVTYVSALQLGSVPWLQGPALSSHPFLKHCPNPAPAT